MWLPEMTYTLAGFRRLLLYPFFYVLTHRLHCKKTLGFSNYGFSEEGENHLMCISIRFLFQDELSKH